MSSDRKSDVRTLLLLNELEDRQTPSSMPTAPIAPITPSTPTALTASSPPTAAPAAAPYALGLPYGQAGNVVVYNSNGTVDYQIPDPYGATFTGGVRVALADVNGDGVPDLITAPGPGTAPVIDVYDGVTQQLITSFDAYDSSFTGGVNVVAADLNGDGKAEIITGADEGGGPRVRVFDGASVASGSTTPTTLDDFLGIDDPNFRGGVRLALGDVNGDGVPDLLVAAGNGGGPRVALYDGASLGKGEQVKLVNDFYAFDPSLRNGVYVSIGDLTGDGFGDLIFGAGPGGGPRVMALNGKDLLAGQTTVLANFFAGSSSSRQGVEVGTLMGTGGATSIVATDLSNNSASLFGADGTNQGPLTGGPGGPLQGLPTGGFGAPIAVTTSTATAVEGTYTGTGSGSLLTFAAGGGAPTSSSPSATITLQITNATLDTPPPGATSTTAYGLTITGSITVAITGLSSVTIPVTGHFRLTSSTAVDGTLDLVQFQPGSGSSGAANEGVVLDGSLSGGTLTLNQFAVFSYSRSSGGYAYHAPASKSATPITLMQSVAVAAGKG